INLVSVVEQCVLTINATPQDAKVSIEGYERKSFACHKNAKVFYVVSKPGYVSVSAEVTVDKDMTINVNLVQSETEAYNYGDWGKPQAFVSCTAFGDLEVQKKCFMLKFENGYLPILFSIYQNAPEASDINEGLFVYEKAFGYDSYARAKGIDKITTISSDKDCIYYSRLDGTLYAAFAKWVMKVFGWQLDDNGKYASVHLNYDGCVSGSAIHVYYKGKEVFVMKGRKNG
ncbi:MAG: PEGA domain-containing protein, partial [Alphaproteobacteria bacterium]|nr:PEGA domain-containing protein [Alphaproteobacteria bacterium]